MSPNGRSAMSSPRSSGEVKCPCPWDSWTTSRFRVDALSNKGEIMNLGAYARYTLADEDISFRIPPGLTGASASTIPLAATTSWLALFSDGCLNMNREKKETVLIWGGACKSRLCMSSCV